MREFVSWLTPNERLFVRSHFGLPPAEAVHPDSWRLTVKGLVKEALSVGLKDLRQFEEVTLTVVLQCSGNGRAHHRPKVPGVQWERGRSAMAMDRGGLRKCCSERGKTSGIACAVARGGSTGADHGAIVHAKYPSRKGPPS